MVSSNVKSNQSGSAIFYILIAVVLFAALGFAFSQSMNSTASNLTKEEARVYAQDILSYANRLSRGVQRVQARGGCSENDISFYLPTNTSLAAYAHSVEVDDRCKVFHEDGGAITWLTAPEGVNDGSDWIFTGSNRVQNIGLTTTPNGNDLVALLPFLDQNICIEINKLLNIENTNGAPPVEATDIGDTRFVGNYTSANNITTTANEISGKSSGCVEATNFGGTSSANSFHFYHVLVAR